MWIYDECNKKLFTLRDMLFGIIIDFCNLGNLPCYNVKGKCVCPVFENDTNMAQLEHGKKSAFFYISEES